MGKNPGTSVGVVDKTLTILTEISKGPLSVHNAAKTTGVSRPTTHRILKSLESHRFVVRDLAGRYAIGPAPFELVKTSVLDPLAVLVNETLADLRTKTGEEIMVFWADGIDRICIAATKPEIFGVEIGSRLALSNTSSSLTILAWSSQRRMAARDQISTTQTEFKSIRNLGWAQAATGTNSINTSAPIRDTKGNVVAALTIAGDRRTNTTPWKLHGPQVKAAAAELTAKLIDYS